MQILFLADGGKGDKACDNDDMGDCCSLDCGNDVVLTRECWRMGTIDLSVGGSSMISIRKNWLVFEF